jgi:hypothetical protein
MNARAGPPPEVAELSALFADFFEAFFLALLRCLASILVPLIESPTAFNDSSALPRGVLNCTVGGMSLIFYLTFLLLL